MQVALYARVATSHQQQEDTLARQVRLLKDYIREQHGHLLPHHEFLDEGIRGARLDRPALDRLRDGAQRGEFGGIARSLIPFLYRFWSFRAINTLF